MGGLFGTMIMLSLSVSFMIDSSIGVEGTFWFYGGLSWLGGLFIHFLLKETKGLSKAEL